MKKTVTMVIIALMTIAAISCKNNPSMEKAEKNPVESSNNSATNSINLTCTAQDGTGCQLLQWNPYMPKNPSEEYVLCYCLYSITSNSDTILIDMFGPTIHSYLLYQEEAVGSLIIAAVTEKQIVFSNTVAETAEVEE